MTKLLVGFAVVFISFFFIFFSEGDTTEAASVAFIDINPCTADPCNLKRGSTYEVSVSIESGPAPASEFAFNVGVLPLETYKI